MPEPAARIFCTLEAILEAGHDYGLKPQLLEPLVMRGRRHDERMLPSRSTGTQASSNDIRNGREISRGTLPGARPFGQIAALWAKEFSNDCGCPPWAMLSLPFMMPRPDGVGARSAAGKMPDLGRKPRYAGDPFIKRPKFQLKAIRDVKMGMAYGSKEFVSRSVLPSQGRGM